MGDGASALFARFSPAESNDEGRAFVQRRIALFAKLMFWSYVALVVFVNVMYEIYPDTRPARAEQINYMAAGGVAILGWAWFVASRERVRSGNALLSLDVAAVVIITGAFSTSAILSSDRIPNVYSSFIWMCFTIFARSLIIPSTGKRTAILSAIGMAPMAGITTFVEMGTPIPAMFVGTTIFCIVVVMLSTVGSHVIYGLRTQVQEAMQLGQYTLEDKIGEGGMGSVYKASHKMLRRPTAIKLLRPERTGRDALLRFQREVQVTSELTHPNTVAVYDYGKSPEGLFYYAMEFLDGVDLETLVGLSGAQPWQRVVHILRQVCGSLEEAHERGLIHRDIKPGNIMLCNRGGIPDVVKVLDFGLAKEIDKDDRLTKADVVTGTPAYLAPEAITHPERLGPLADLYAVGAVGYFLLTGQPVFEGRSLVETCMHHVSSEPKLPSSRTDNAVPNGLESLLLQCLAKEPSSRPANARELRLAFSELATTSRWTEDAALRWWREFETDHGAELHTSSPSSLTTMTVDVSSRTVVDDMSARLGRVREGSPGE